MVKFCLWMQFIISNYYYTIKPGTCVLLILIIFWNYLLIAVLIRIFFKAFYIEEEEKKNAKKINYYTQKNVLRLNNGNASSQSLNKTSLLQLLYVHNFLIISKERKFHVNLSRYCNCFTSEKIKWSLYIHHTVIIIKKRRSSLQCIMAFYSILLSVGC